MPKDANKNVDRYKVRGGQLNEYEYQKNQAETAAEKKPDINKTKATKTPGKGTKKK